MKKLIFVLLFVSFTASAITEKDLLPGQSCRSQSVKKAFDKKSGFPKGRKSYIVDHICALSCGGLDIPSNMQYQTLAESRAKDRWETTKKGCSLTCNPTNSKPTRTVFNCK